MRARRGGSLVRSVWRSMDMPALEYGNVCGGGVRAYGDGMYGRVCPVAVRRAWIRPQRTSYGVEH